MKKRSAALLFIVALVSLLVLTACGAVSDLKLVGDAGKAFMAAMEKQDSAATWGMMITPLQDDIGSYDAWDGYVQSFQFTEAKFNSTNIENNIGYLDGTAKVDGDTYAVNLVFDKVDSGWMLSGLNFELQ